MKWRASKAMWAAILAMTILRSVNAGWRAERLQTFILSCEERLPGELRGAIPKLVGSWSKLTQLHLAFQTLSGSIPHVIGSMTALTSFNVVYNMLHGPIPDAVGSLLRLASFEVEKNSLRGPIPHAVGSLLRLASFEVDENSLRGPIPHGIGFMAAIASFGVEQNILRGPIPDAAGLLFRLECFNAKKNSLRGPIPHVVGSMASLITFLVERNIFRGPIPHSVGSLLRLQTFNVGNNALRGPIPHVVGSLLRMSGLCVMSKNSLSGPIPHSVGSLLILSNFYVEKNSLCGPIPHAVGRMLRLRTVHVEHNSLCGPIPHAIGSMQKLETIHVGHNSLRGPIPEAVGSMVALINVHVGHNCLCGPIPDAVGSGASLKLFDSSDNQLSGSLPSGFFVQGGMRFIACISHNQLTGTLPALTDVKVLIASKNFFEGGLPTTFSSHLRVLDVSGALGRNGGLLGPLPPALCQASELKILTLAYQQMYGSIPSFTSTLSLLSLHNNRLKVLSDCDIVDDASTTTILLHNNFLSCNVPMFGDANTKTSIIAIGNRLGYPKGQFPAWVHKYEHDPLLWISGAEGMSLVRQISGAACLFMFVVASKLGSDKLLRAMSGWQIGPATHLWVVNASSHIHTCMAVNSALAAVFIVFLLSWDLYVCPQTLAILSACSRSSTLIRTLVLFFWCKLCFHSLVVEHFAMEGGQQKKKKRLTTKLLRKELLLWLLWCVLTAVLSALPILYQVAKTIPDALQAGKIWSLGMKAFIGVTQGLVGTVLIPYFASKMTRQKHVFATVSSLLMNCVIPAVVILDG